MDVNQEKVMGAAISWFVSKRPAGWGERWHSEHPAINTTTPQEAELAHAVAEYLRLKAAV